MRFSCPEPASLRDSDLNTMSVSNPAPGRAESTRNLEWGGRGSGVGLRAGAAGNRPGPADVDGWEESKAMMVTKQAVERRKVPLPVH